MHLGLIEGPFVSHNLISAQGSTDLLLKFQMAPKLKILMSCGSKKVIQIYFSFSLKKSRQINPTSFPNGAPLKRDTHLQDPFAYLSNPS